MGILAFSLSPASLAAQVVKDLLSALAHALSGGIVSLASFAIAGLDRAATSTTAVSFDTWFKGPWRAMLSVGGIVAVPLLFVGVISALLRGEGPGGVARVLARLVGAGVGGLFALAGVELLLSLVDVCCEVVEHGSGLSLSAALARLATALGVTGGISGGAGAALLAILAALGALVVWLELAIRSALIFVAVAFIPLALAGAIWSYTTSWIRRLGEVIAAVAVSKLVIVVVLVLGAAALSSSPVSISAPGADIDAVVNGVAFLALATLALPMALRLVPMAAEAAVSAGFGVVLVRKGLRAPATVASHVSSTGALVGKLGGTASAASAAPSFGGASANGSSASAAKARNAGGQSPNASRPTISQRPPGAPRHGGTET